jgi:hypothetical protein
MIGEWVPGLVGPPSEGARGWDHPSHGVKKENATKRLRKAAKFFNFIFNTSFIFNISLGNAYFKEFVMPRGHPRMMKMIAKNELDGW